jgi:cell division protease FtsH
VSDLVDSAYKRAKLVLTQNRHILDRIAEMLIERETVDSDELQEIINTSDVRLAGIL